MKLSLSLLIMSLSLVPAVLAAPTHNVASPKREIVQLEARNHTGNFDRRDTELGDLPTTSGGKFLPNLPAERRHHPGHDNAEVQIRSHDTVKANNDLTLEGRHHPGHAVQANSDLGLERRHHPGHDNAEVQIRSHDTVKANNDLTLESRNHPGHGVKANSV
ncbi:hypothetical protein FA15DRAFT_51795 [Coprinopsis marcescibilis]|uniref:Uncharacterized protein n=1 Tax=Coprinopsis marcescibilis TaxID=230819 RepID=A0A5C3KNS7_COPMA|nr:hypothetical protein FA15DRAFT_51795 [Coprinopsis marcescibilis]